MEASQTHSTAQLEQTGWICDGGVVVVVDTSPFLLKLNGPQMWPTHHRKREDRDGIYLSVTVIIIIIKHTHTHTLSLSLSLYGWLWRQWWSEKEFVESDGPTSIVWNRKKERKKKGGPPLKWPSFFKSHGTSHGPCLKTKRQTEKKGTWQPSQRIKREKKPTQPHTHTHTHRERERDRDTT